MSLPPSRRGILCSGAVAGLLPLSASSVAQTLSPPVRVIDAGQALDIEQRRAIDVDSDIADVSAGLQRLVDRLVSTGGGMLFLPPGYYALSRPLRIPVGVDLVGAGSATVLRPRGCPAIELHGKTGFARTRIDNLKIQGTSTTKVAAIAQASTRDPTDELAGLVVTNLQIDHFATAVQLATVRHAAISHSWFRDVGTGIALVGKCFVVDIDTVTMVATEGTQGDGLLADGRRYDNGMIVRPETVRVRNLYAYGFHTGVRFEGVVHGVVEDCDISARRDGISWSSASGVVNIRGGYVELQGRDAHAGAWGKDQSEPTGVLVNLFGTCFLHGGGSNDAVGILLGTPGGGGNQNNVTVTHCILSGFGRHDIAVYRSGDIDISGNRCRSVTPQASIVLSEIAAGRPVSIEHNRCAGPIAYDKDAVARGDLYLSRNAGPVGG